MINNFAIFKNRKKEEGDNKPDYVLNAKITDGNTDSYQEIGAAYIKDGKAGKYFSCSLKKPYADKPGYVIITTEQYNAMKQAWDDWQIKMRNGEYPTPTELGIDLSKTGMPQFTEDELNEALNVPPENF